MRSIEYYDIVVKKHDTSNVTMLGLKEKLPAVNDDTTGELVITVPQLTIDQLPCQYAWSFKITNAIGH
jgi:alpha-L-fucosidase